jgi:hypothetical protein
MMSRTISNLAQDSLTIPDHLVCSPSAFRSKPRARLSAGEVVQIFWSRQEQKSSTVVSRLYGVNEKTVRDIWSGRTWAKETQHLDPSRHSRIEKIWKPRGGKHVKKSTSLQVQDLQDLTNFSYMGPEDKFIPYASKDQAAEQTSDSIDEQLYLWDLNDCWIDAIVQVITKTK